VLAGIARLADGLDRSHHQLVQDVRIEVGAEQVTITAEVVGDAELEIWGARRKSRLLERALKRKVELRVEAVSALRQIA
jgi:exopolyphosphatase/guanosine-5'-triphosphate,3'-diphosphate pyrophosphatase